LQRFGGSFDTAAIAAECTALEEQMNQPEFWNDPRSAQKITKKINQLRGQLEEDARLVSIGEEMQTYMELLKEDFSDLLLQEAAMAANRHKETLDAAETKFLLSGKYDSADAILNIHPGAGGTESQDWAEILFRMYKRWAESNGYKYTLIDFQPGDEAGIKNVTMEIFGDYAYGNLRSEIGIHRLVRISPFNAQGKRQTSFASVFVYPMLDDDIEIDIDANDLRVDTYRSSGKGGQGVNTTDSAVRITHLPTGIVVQCQNERSQIMNRETAMKILKSRLYQHYEEQREKERQELEGSKSDIGWGNQIRSYVFHPYQMVKDHRTNFESGNTSSVMDGNLGDFIAAYLRFSAAQKAGA
jgi:peptide chain release factor 2